MLEQLDPEIFTFENYEPDFGYRLGCYWTHYPETFQFDFFLTKLKKFAIGWCDASRLRVRPKNDSTAIMCEDENGKFWFHILDKTAVALGLKRKVF